VLDVPDLIMYLLIRYTFRPNREINIDAQLFDDKGRCHYHIWGKSAKMLHWGSRIFSISLRNIDRGASASSQLSWKTRQIRTEYATGHATWMKLRKKKDKGAHGEEPVAVVRTS
jgi:hypothetical protein